MTHGFKRRFVIFLLHIISYMDFSKIKNLVKQNGDKFIFLEDGEPELVVMSFHEYEKISKADLNKPVYANDASSNGYEMKPLSKQNYEAVLADLEMEKIMEKEMETRVAMEKENLPLNLEDIRLEDLPI